MFTLMPKPKERKILKKHQVAFEDLFKDKTAAVVCYLSLEERHMDIQKRYKDLYSKCVCQSGKA